MRNGIDRWMPDIAYDDAPSMNMGSASGLQYGEDPPVRNKIGFQVRREKPRVRIKAWTRPVLEGL